MEYIISLPSKPRVINEKEFSAQFEIDGLYPGYGHTLGNSLRRIILSSLPGAAITAVNIEGVQHEFSTIPGVAEDVVTILLNLRKVRFELLTDGPVTVEVKKGGITTITAGDLEASGNIRVLNPDEVIATLTDKSAKFVMEATIEKGLGYVPREVHQKDRVDVGTISLDAVFSPIRRVSYDVENMRVGDRTDFNRLKVMIETDGTLTPREALERSIEIMIHQLKAVIGFSEEVVVEEVAVSTTQPLAMESTEDKNKNSIDPEVLKTRIEDLNLSPRVTASLTGASIRTVGGLVRKTEEDVLALEGLGQKGLQEIVLALRPHGLTLKAS
jgi:DNA-directed RNA polymerase subunit alpha